MSNEVTCQTGVAGVCAVTGTTRHRMNVSRRSVLIITDESRTLLCATSTFSVSLWLTEPKLQLTTETQRTQRLHREIRIQHYEPTGECRATSTAAARGDRAAMHSARLTTPSRDSRALP